MQKPLKNKKFSALTKFIFAGLGLLVIIAVWWILADTKFKSNGIIPAPPLILQIIIQEIQKPIFSKAVNATISRSIYSFIIAFLSSTLLAIISSRVKSVHAFLRPFMTVFRAMPTMALIIILLMIVGSKTLPVVIAFLIVFPLSYENMHEAICGIDNRLLQMARVFKVSHVRQLFTIHLPSVLPYMFACIVSGFGLNLKVVIAAEIMGLPTISIGYLILTTKQEFDFSTSFAWLVIAVVLSYICEFLLRMLGRLLMPWKYPDQKNIKRFFASIYRFFKEKLLGDAK